MWKGLAIALLFVAAGCGSAVSPGLSSAGGAASTSRTASTSREVWPGTPLPAAQNGTGSIAGHLGYPAGSLPAQVVYAISTDGRRFYTVATAYGQSQYKMIGLAEGDYFVLATLPYLPGFGAHVNANDRFGAGFTKFIECGATVGCADHSLIPVQVVSGTTISGIDPLDWYAGPEFFPLIPPGGPPRLSLGEPPEAFQDSTKAADYLAQAVTESALAQTSAACPANAACVWITAEHTGHLASYFTLDAGSNGLNQTCAIYLISTSASWQALGGGYGGPICSSSGMPFPGVGVNGEIQTGPGDCANVHSSPSLSAKVVACLPAGTGVSIDDGPAYVPAANAPPQTDLPWALDYWWHLEGRGWVVHADVMTRHYG